MMDQAPTSPRVLVLMISLLKPFSASATRFDNTSFNFPSFGYESLKLLDIQGNASVRSPNLYLSPSQPNQNPSGDCGQATYSREVHLWDKATGNAADFAAQFVFSIDSRNRNVSGDRLAFFVAPPGSGMSCDLGGEYLGLPKGSFVAIEVDTYKNPWDADVPHVGIDLNDIRSATNVTVPWLNEAMKGGGLVNASITYDSQAHNLSVVLMHADGNSSNDSVSLHYNPLNLSEYLPEWVDVGFSAATGAAFEYHIVHSWEFSSSLRVRGEEVAFSWWKWLLIVTGGVLGSVLIRIASIAWVRYTSKGNRPYRGNDLPGGNDEPKTTEENKSRPREVEEAGNRPYRSNDLPGGNNEPKTTEEKKSRPREVEEAGNRSVKLTQELEQFSGPKKFSFEELTAATDSFAHDRILGKGGFGTVYEGQIGDARTVVAVKVMNSDSGQGIQEYVSEVRSISQLKHRNLVQLIGYCHEANNFALVYEFTKQGSLEDHLFKGRTLLTWERRYDIALGLASGLHYLHKGCKQCVIHRDIKSSNTMLDEMFEAKLEDFGLARLVDHARGRKTTEMIGTWGYAAPEYCETGKASKESDVYSFGVVLLEIVCGRSVLESAQADQALVKWVWEQYGRRKLLNAVDWRLGMNFDKKQAKALMVAGLWCAHPTVSSRPSIEAAMAVLNLKARRPNLPSIMPQSQHVTDPKVSARCFCL